MRVNCVGDDCYSIKSGKLWEHAPVTPSGAMACSLLPFIPPVEWKGFCALCELAKRKRRGPGSRVYFTYREIERISGIRHQHQSKLWKCLEALELIEDFKPSPPQAEKKHRWVSSCRIPRDLPSVDHLQNGLLVVGEIKKRKLRKRTPS